ncbi:MAG: 2OG-Fe dioxygenase family protein [Gallionella sp.]
MSISVLDPTFSSLAQLLPALRNQGYAVLRCTDLAALSGVSLAQFAALKDSWNHLPPDAFLKDGGRYRSRRHASFIIHANTIELVAHRAHYQPLAYNALHGGMHRLFDAIEPHTLGQAAWNTLLIALASVCSAVKGAQPWYVEAHQFRIDTRHGIGRPTPEGAHRDGVDFVAIVLVDRVNVSGGESRVFEAEGRNGQRFTLTEPWTLVLLDDQKVIHESTPIQALAEDTHRDTLVLTFRADGFLEATPVA